MARSWMSGAAKAGGALALAWALLSGTLLSGTLLAGALLPAPAAAALADAARLAAVLPGATRIGPAEGTPPVHEGWRGTTPAGYVFSSRDVLAAASAGLHPLDLLIGIDRDCRIAGVELLEHREPLFVTGVPESALGVFVQHYVGLDIARRVALTKAAPEGQAVQVISRATLSSYALHDAILGAARQVARARNLPCIAVGGSARLNLDAFTPETWEALREDGSIARLHITAGEAVAALRRAGGDGGTAARLPPEANFATLYTALATPAQIGGNLLGQKPHAQLVNDIGPGASLLFLAGNGLYSFRGHEWLRSGVLGRIQLVQGERTFPLTAAQHRALEAIPARDAPELREISLFVLPADSAFAPGAPWRIDLLASDGKASAPFALAYTLPARYHAPAAAPAVDEAPLWHEIWRGAAVRIGILAAALLGLYTVLAFQDQVAARRRLWNRLRLFTLGFTLLWLGWYAGAQLSVVHVLTFLDAVRTAFQWDYFLADPLTFILWSWVALAIAFWGRGVFCGWLCPFGALQDLMHRIGRLLRLPAIRLPWALHERLIPTKYILFFILLAVSLGDMALALVGSEVEPFRTAIVLRFMRWGPLLLYALALLGAAMVIERFFCRYLCPLGAAIALPARLRVFNWLKRRPQCGTECHICELHCPVQAINLSGEIHPNECIHCLRCQVNYYDDELCPPLIQRRQRRTRRAALRQETAA